MSKDNFRMSGSIQPTPHYALLHTNLLSIPRNTNAWGAKLPAYLPKTSKTTHVSVIELMKIIGIVS